MNELDFLNNEEAIKTSSKKDLYNILYKKIESYYNDFNKNAFDILNDKYTKNNIINEIFETTKYNLDDEVYLKEQYSKINKHFYNDYKNYVEDEPIETEQEKKLNINWPYLFQTLAFIAFFPIYLILVWMGGINKK